MQEILEKLKSIFRVPMLLIFVIICLWFLPDAINMRSAVFRSAIVVAFGLDLDENRQYIINAAINVSAVDDSLSENTKLISAKGPSVSEAITNLGIQFGRNIKFGHTRFLLIGTNLAKQNLAVALDGVIRTNKMRDTIQLILCNANVADMLNVGIEIKNKTGIKMSEILTYQSKFSTVSMDSNVDTFYKGYFSRSGISKLNCVSLTNDVTKGITPEAALGEIGDPPKAPDAGVESGAGGGSSSKEETNPNKPKYISSTGEIGVFKNGVLQEILPLNIAEGAQWMNSSFLPKKLEVNVTNKHLNNAEVFFYVLEKTVSREMFFYRGVPVISNKLDITLGIDEIINPNGEITPLSEDIVDQDVKCAIGRKIRQKTAETLKYSKDLDLDILELNELFYFGKYKEYMQYLHGGKTPDDFVEDVQISMEIRVKVI